jgi:hypothetical protein
MLCEWLVISWHDLSEEWCFTKAKKKNDLSLFFVRGGELEIKGKEQSVMTHDSSAAFSVVRAQL